MSASNIKEEDMFQILLATDNHLGYMERDAVRGSDAITTFEEILEIATQKKVDFVLLGGDLFHENKPSRKTMHQCMTLLRKFCLGDGAVKFNVVSNQEENFKQSGVKCVNYQDPNINIKLPIFSVHGNHDDPAGAGSYCTLDILSLSGLVNYFGKCTDLDNVKVKPLLLEKGCTKLALFGLGSIRDERLHRLFREGKVNLLRPKESTDEWFNVFVLHQNRTKHGATNYIPETFIHEFLDLIIWGHEHECRIIEEWNTEQSFYVTQPGSSVATSLCHGESVPKNVGLLQIYKKTFKITQIPLKTVRPFYISDIDLDNISVNLNDPEATEKVSDYLKEVVEEYIHKADIERSGHSSQPDKPLIRLRVQYPEHFETFNVQRFGQTFVDRVANPKDIILFSRKKLEKLKVNLIDADALSNALKQQGVDKSRVEDLVKEYFQLADESKKLALLSEYGISNAVQEYVDKEVSEAIGVLVDHQLKKVQGHLQKEEVKEEMLDEEIENFRQERLKNSCHELTELQEALKMSKSHTQNQDKTNNSNFFDDDDDMEINLPPTRGRGHGRGGRGSRGGRGRGSAKTSNASSSSASETQTKSRASSRNVSRNSRSSSKKESNASAVWKASGKQSSMRSFLNANSDSETIEDSDDDVIVQRSNSNKRVNITANSSSKKRGIMYESCSDDSM